MHGAAGLPAALIAATLLTAAPAGANTGRVAFPVGLPAPARNVDVTGATAAAVRPDGGAVLVGDEPDGGGFVAAAVDPAGAVDRAFGPGGRNHVGVGGRRFTTISVLARPDGRLLVVGTQQPAGVLQLPELLVVGLTPSGRVDPSFGDGGVARPGIQDSCAGICEPAALAQDGSLVLTGNTGSQSPEIAHDPNAPDTFAWVVTRLTPTGQPDPAFGVRPVPGTTPGDGYGYGAAVGADGRIALLGAQGSRSAAARLLPDGSADPSFAGGGLATVPSRFALSFSVGADGSVTALGMGSVSRLRPDGSIDAGFGDGGSVALDAPFGRVLGIGGGQVLVYRSHVQAQPARQPAMVIDRLDAAGRRTTAKLHLPFGGGVASFYRALRFTPSLDQNAFRAAALLPRPGGGYLAAGGVTIQQYSGEGEGWSTAWFAGAALTPSLALDHAYGPGKARVSTSVRVVRQRARASRRLRGIAVRIRASAPGLARVRIRDRRGRMLARGVEPLYAAGADVVRVPLTRAGRRALRHGPVRVRVSSRFRSVLAAEAAARGASGTLR